MDSKDVFLNLYNQLSDKYKYKKIKPEDIEELRKLSIKERCQKLRFPLYKMPFLAVEFYKLYKISIKNVVLIDGIKNLLEALNNKGYQLAIISSNDEQNIRDFLQKNQIDNIKEVLCSNNIFGKDKVITKFLKSYDLNQTEVIYVGDELRDIAACKKINVKVIWVSWGYDAIELANKECPDYIVNAPEEILCIV